MKKSHSLALLLCFISSCAFAQGQGTEPTATGTAAVETGAGSGGIPAKANVPRAGISALLLQLEKPDRIMIADVLKGGAAERAGLISKDEILQIDGNAIPGMDLFQAYTLLWGEPGSAVKITVLRKGVAHPIYLELHRELETRPNGKELSAMEASLIGKWKDENSSYQFNPDGTAIDDRPGMHLSGHWVLENDVLKFIPPVYTGLLPSQHRVISVTADELVLQGLRSGQTFRSKRAD